MRSLERVNIRTNVRTYSHTYVRDRPYIPSTTLLCEGLITTSVRFCLSYDPLKWDFIAFKMGNSSRRKRIVDTDVVNDVTSTRQSVITPVVIRVL